MSPVAHTLTRVLASETLRDAPRKAFLIRMSQVSNDIWELASRRIWDRIPATSIAFDLVLYFDDETDIQP